MLSPGIIKFINDCLFYGKIEAVIACGREPREILGILPDRWAGQVDVLPYTRRGGLWEDSILLKLPIPIPHVFTSSHPTHYKRELASPFPRVSLKSSVALGIKTNSPSAVLPYHDGLPLRSRQARDRDARWPRWTLSRPTLPLPPSHRRASRDAFWNRGGSGREALRASNMDRNVQRWYTGGAGGSSRGGRTSERRSGREPPSSDRVHHERRSHPRM